MITGLQLNAKIAAIHWLLSNDERFIEFLFSHKKPELRAPSDELLSEARCFSRGEQLLIQVAIDFWSREGDAKLSDLLDAWDDDRWRAFIDGVIRLKELA